MVALKPGVPQPGLLPVVMSFQASGVNALVAYTSGLRKPSGGRPLERRAELSSETMPATAGAEAEVPPMERMRPLRKMRKKRPWAATSGMA